MTTLPLRDAALLKSAYFVDGEWIVRTEAGSCPVLNPADGSLIAEVPRCRERETGDAIAAAERAFGSWRHTLPHDRAAILVRWHDLVRDHEHDLAVLITLEEGKPLAESLGELRYARSFIQWFAEEAKRMDGDIVTSPRASTKILVTKEPVGVCGAITPWNFPAAMVTRKIAPALAAGCTIVLKPAEQTPLTALALADLATRAGVPRGVFNVVTGAREDAPIIGAALTSSEVVRKITFTGSTPVGRTLLLQSAQSIKKVSMELGGNAPFIVFDDASMEAAVESLMVAKFRNTGQSCIAANRVLVQSGIHDEFLTRLTRRMQSLQVQEGFVEAANIGPLIDARALAKVQRHVENALQRGAQCRLGGQRHALGGNFFEPTLLVGCKAGMLVATEETFGPVLSVFRFDDEAHAVDLANDTPFGLAAYLCSESAARIWRVSAQLDAGMLGINCGLISNEVAPFGGVKQSGLGREGSRHGIDEYLELKYLCWQTG